MSEDLACDYSLVVAFEDQTPAYAYGFEAGIIYKCMQDDADEISSCCHTENLTTFVRMARACRYSIETRTLTDPAWIDVIFRKNTMVSGDAA